MDVIMDHGVRMALVRCCTHGLWRRSGTEPMVCVHCWVPCCWSSASVVVLSVGVSLRRMTARRKRTQPTKLSSLNTPPTCFPPLVTPSPSPLAPLSTMLACLLAPDGT